MVLGNIIGQFIVYFTGMTTVFTLGGSMIFDASVITLVFSVILASVAYGSKTNKNMHAHSAAEAGEDNADMDEFDDFLNK